MEKITRQANWEMLADDKANEIVRCLCEKGWDAYIAGGAARDMLCGEKPMDYDVVTDAPYEIVKALFQNRKVSLVGESFKVCIVDGVEVATYRKDTYFGLSNKNCEIKEANSIEEDLARRDLTINAIAVCPYTGDVVDHHGGIDDLRNRVIRFTGNPKDRIYEDPCRILRACRFLAKIQGTFDPETRQALEKHRKLVLHYVAPERIRLEILKALKYPKASLFFDALHEIDLLQDIFPGLDACYGHAGGPYHDETLDQHFKAVGDYLTIRKPLLRLCGYLHDIGKPPAAAMVDQKLNFIGHERLGAEMVINELENLRFSRKEVIYVSHLIRHHMRSVDANISNKAVRRLLKKLKDDGVDWKDWLMLKVADSMGNAKKTTRPADIGRMVLKIWRQLKPMAENTALSINDLKVNGNDLKEAFDLDTGPEIGRLLAKLLDRVLDDPKLNSRSRLLRLAKDLLL